MLQIPKKAREWFENANKEERLAFMAGGKPDTQRTINTKTGQLQYYPAVRGFLVGEIQESEDKALEKARQFIKGCVQTPGLPKIDDEGLGLKNVEIFEQIQEESPIKIGPILHLATSIGDHGPQALIDVFDDADIELDGQDMSFMPPEIASCVPQFDDDDDEPTQRELFSLFTEHLVENGVLGFLIQAAVPTVQSTTEKGGAIYSWGRYRTRLFYGETYWEAFEKAREWADDAFKLETENT